MISPSSFAVRALKFLQKSMMLTPCGPSAVPTGGAGVALPAAIWSFTIAVIFFAILKPTHHRGHGGHGGTFLLASQFDSSASSVSSVVEIRSSPLVESRAPPA